MKYAVANERKATRHEKKEVKVNTLYKCYGMCNVP